MSSSSTTVPWIRAQMGGGGAKEVTQGNRLPRDSRTDERSELGDPQLKRKNFELARLPGGEKYTFSTG